MKRFLPVLDCGPHSTYNPKGNACPNSCGDMNNAAQCSDPAKPMCECNEGYILGADGQCAPYQSCGCTDDAGNNVPVS